MKQLITMKHESWKRYSLEEYLGITNSLTLLGATPERIGSGAYDMIDYSKQSNENAYNLMNSGEGALVFKRKKAPKLETLVTFKSQKFLDNKTDPSKCIIDLSYTTIKRKKMTDKLLASFVDRHVQTNSEISCLSLRDNTIKNFSSETIPKILDFYMSTSISLGLSIHWLTIFGKKYVSFLGGVDFIKKSPAIVQELPNGNVLLKMSKDIEDIYDADYQRKRDEIADYLDPDKNKIFRMRWVHEHWKRPLLKTPWRDYSDKSMMVPRP